MKNHLITCGILGALVLILALAACVSTLFIIAPATLAVAAMCYVIVYDAVCGILEPAQLPLGVRGGRR